MLQRIEWVTLDMSILERDVRKAVVYRVWRERISRIPGTYCYMMRLRKKAWDKKCQLKIDRPSWTSEYPSETITIDTDLINPIYRDMAGSVGDSTTVEALTATAKDSEVLTPETRVSG